MLISAHPEKHAFVKPRHPGECRDPGKLARYWISAFAGMMSVVVSGWALINFAMNYRRRVWIVLFCVLFSGCGFHLKGYRQLSPALNGLYIFGFEQRESLAGLLYENLRGSGVILAAEVDSARLTLKVIEEKLSSRVLAVDADGKALDKELHLSTTIGVKVPGNPEQGAEQQLELVRQLSFSGVDELGQRNETDLMKYDMRYEMVQQIIRRLEAITNGTGFNK